MSPTPSERVRCNVSRIHVFIGNLAKIIWSLSKQPITQFAPAFDYVTRVAWESLNDYLPQGFEIERWAIVGGHLGEEIPRITRRYRSAELDVFECSFRYFPILRQRFSDSSRVNILNVAIGSLVGRTIFYETTLDGSGSILPLGQLHMSLFSSQPAESFEVEVTTLDQFYRGRSLDVLQLDVQGAELEVLKGARETLKKVRAVLIEVSHDGELYKGGSAFGAVRELLDEQGFLLAVFGVDRSMTGNALFVKP